MTLLHTTRLTLRPLELADLDPFHRLITMPGVMRFLFDGAALDRDSAKEMLERSVAMQAADGTGLWAIHPHHRMELLGVVGLWPFHEPARLELVYALADNKIGHGHATEAALAIMDDARTRLGWRSMAASTDAPNAGSLRVLERLGFQEVDRTPGPFGQTVHFARAL
jgi:RimJ/RimL family protein N-acetyltransferase